MGSRNRNRPSKNKPKVPPVMEVPASVDFYGRDEPKQNIDEGDSWLDSKSGRCRYATKAANGTWKWYLKPPKGFEYKKIHLEKSTAVSLDGSAITDDQLNDDIPWTEEDLVPNPQEVGSPVMEVDPSPETLSAAAKIVRENEKRFQEYEDQKKSSTITAHCLGLHQAPEGEKAVQFNGNSNKVPDDAHRITVMQDHNLKYDELWAGVYIVGDMMEQRNFTEMFARARCWKAKTLDEADLVVFTGGADVDPILYGVTNNHPSVCFSPARDAADIAVWQECLSKGIPMIGICRGAQFGHVMMGGKLYQDVDGHYSDHKMWDFDQKVWIDKVSSVHHQMIIPNSKGGMRVLATAPNVAKKRYLNAKDVDNLGQDVEAFFYRDSCFIGIQGHPEYKGYNYFATWTIKKILELIIENPDTELIDGYRRVKPDIVAQRKALWEDGPDNIEMLKNSIQKETK